MSVFKDSAQFYDTVGELMSRAGRDPKVGPKIAKSNLIIQFRYSDPDAITTVVARGRPADPQTYVDVIHGPTDLKGDIVMSMAADVAHAFWHGKVNLMRALSKREIVADGPIPKILKLLPAVQPLYKQYPVLLREKGLDELVIN